MKQLAEYLTQNPKKHLVFDFDATLFLLILPWGKWTADMRAELSKIDPLIWDEYDQGLLTFAEVQNKYIHMHGPRARDLMHAYNASFELNELERVERNHELLAFVESMPPKTHKYIWSSNTRNTIDTVLAAEGLSGHFEKIVTRDDVEHIKPLADGFDLINPARTDLESYLMIGDSSADEGAAQNAGIDFFRIDYFTLQR